MNQLKVNLQHAIIVLAAGGMSGRDIARHLGIERSTVARYLALAAAAPAISTPGSAGDLVSGWRRNQSVCGKPDFIFPKAQLALFVDGCFWHCCPKHCKTSASNRAYWKEKIAANKARDRRVNRELRKLGWGVHRIWEHDLRSKHSRVVRKVLKAMGATS